MFRKIGQLGGLLALALAAAVPATPALAQKNADPAVVSPIDMESVSLNGTWQFALAPTEDDAAKLAQFYKDGFDSSGFKPIPVPSNWAMLGHETPHYDPFDGPASEGFYLRRFTVPANWKGRRTLLHFGGVWSSAEVWLNGKLLGRHDSGYTKISLDISSVMKPGADNILAVRVRQVQPDYLFDTNDDWAMGGIYRDVSLETMPRERWLDRVETQIDFDDQYRDADLKVRVMVGDEHPRIPPGNFMYPGGDPYEVRLALRDSVGKLVREQTIAVQAHSGTGRETIAALHVERPSHWTAETPNLYTLSVDLLENGKLTHSRNVRVGFREVSTAGGVLRVNGQAVKLRGVNRHDEHPDVGRATTPEQWLQDITLMKAANINYIRVAHYPPAEGFLDLCDELGIYVSDEISMGAGGNQMHNPVFAGATMLRSYLTVARDINHPSVIIWTVGNEDPLTSLHLASIRTIKGLDPTRPLLMPWRAETWLPPEIDILSPHYFTAEKYDELASRAERPIVTTEFSHAYGNEGFGGLAERWKALTRHPSGAGGAIWMWADQGLTLKRRKPDGTEESYLALTTDGFDGITDSYRKPTRDYWEAKAVYAPVYPAIDTAEFVLGQAVARIPIQNEYDFTDLGSVGVRWSLMEDDRQLAAGNAKIAGPPHARSWLEVPLNGLKDVKPDMTYTLRLSFLRPDGSELNQSAVELLSKVAPSADAVPSSRPVVADAGDTVSITAGAASYVFDRRTGEIRSASFDGDVRLLGGRPTIWRPMNPSEMIIVKREGGVQNLPDLNRYTASVSKWNVSETARTVTIHVEATHVVDENNRFTVAYDYAVDASGRLTVRYSVQPTVQAKWLPHVGVDLRLPERFEQLRWLGLGPLDAYPNEQSAPILGVWSDKLGAQADGNKATRWVQVSDGSGAGLKVRGNGYANYGAGETGRLRILSSVLGRPGKAWRPEDASYRLDTGTEKPFVGEFTVDLMR